MGGVTAKQWCSSCIGESISELTCYVKSSLHAGAQFWMRLRSGMTPRKQRGRIAIKFHKLCEQWPKGSVFVETLPAFALGHILRVSTAISASSRSCGICSTSDYVLDHLHDWCPLSDAVILAQNTKARHLKKFPPLELFLYTLLSPLEFQQRSKICSN